MLSTSEPSRSPLALAAITSPRAAVLAHYVSLAIGTVIVLVAGRNQWFFYDEWSFMAREESILAGHNGHWSTVAVLIWNALQGTFGLSSYAPFLVASTVAHLIAVHLIWRLMLRLGAAPWMATLVGALAVVLGAGAENLLWGFQVGFVGAMCLGFGAVLVVLRTVPGRWDGVLTAGLLLAGLATSGTAIPFVIAVAVIGVHRRGWKWTIAVLAVPVVAYAIWYTMLAGPNPTDKYRIDDVVTALRAAPQYMGSMIVGGWDTVTPLALGAIAVAVMVIWTLKALARRADTTAVTCAALIVAVVGFGLLSGYSRYEAGAAGATSSRYVYLLVFTTAPVLAVTASRFLRGRWQAWLAVMLSAALVIVFNVGLLFERARMENGREDQARQTISAAIDLAERFPDSVDLGSSPERNYTPATLREVLGLHRDQGLSTVSFGERARADAMVNVGITLEEATNTAVGRCVALPAEVAFHDAQESVLVARSDATFSLTATTEGTRSGTRKLSREAGTYRLSGVPDTTFTIAGDAPDAFLCDLR